MRGTLTAVVLAFAVATPAQAQRVARFVAPTPAPMARAPTPNIPMEVLAGVGTMIPGALLGGLAGVAIAVHSPCNGDMCGLEGLALGMVAGGTLAIPLGVHLANHRRGNFGLSLLASAVIGGASIGSAYVLNNGIPIIAGPVLSFVSAVLIENHTAAQRAAPAH